MRTANEVLQCIFFLNICRELSMWKKSVWRTRTICVAEGFSMTVAQTIMVRLFATTQLVTLKRTVYENEKGRTCSNWHVKRNMEQENREGFIRFCVPVGWSSRKPRFGYVYFRLGLGPTDLLRRAVDEFTECQRARVVLSQREFGRGEHCSEVFKADNCVGIAVFVHGEYNILPFRQREDCPSDVVVYRTGSPGFRSSLHP